MREHPIPQDITGYRFHIVGSMTLKQFAEIGIGVGVAIILYNTNLFGFIKWPLILLSFGLGTIAAFVPIGERPLDHWIITFFKVLYKPTQFFWKREPRIPDVFSFVPNLNTKDTGPELDLTPARRERIKEFLVTLRTPLSVQATDLDLAEVAHLESVVALFGSATPQPANTSRPAHKQTKPHLEVRVRNLGSTQFKKHAPVVQNQAAVTDPTITTSQATQKQSLAADVVAQAISIPKIQEITTNSAQVLKDASEINAQSLDEEQRTFIQTKNQTDALPDQAETVATNKELPFPTKPTEPNKLVGMVLTQNNELVADAIVEIQAPTGQIVRAVKTNALGQFFVTTPLRAGEYRIVTEKDFFAFNPVSLTLKNSVVEPIEIRGEKVA